MSRVLKQLFKDESKSAQPHLKLVQEEAPSTNSHFNYANRPVKGYGLPLILTLVVGVGLAVFFAVKLLSHRTTEKELKEELAPAPEVNLHPDHRLNREGIKEIENRNDPKALEIFEKLAKAHPELSSSQNNYGFALFRNGKLKEAKIKLKKSIDLDSSNFIAHINLAMVLMEEGKYDESVKSLQQAVALNKDYPDTYLNLGKVYEKAGKFNEAIQSYESYLALNKAKKLMKGLIQNRIKKLKSLNQYQENGKEETNVGLPKAN